MNFVPCTVRRPRIIAPVLLVVAGLTTGIGIGATGTSSAQAPHPWAPGSARVSGETIVEVSGGPARGFTIYRLNGTIESPPTDSEARAECSEYDTKRQRRRCRTEVRQWYADLGVLRDTIDYYQRLFD